MSVLRTKCVEGKIVWSACAASRLMQRGISRADVLNRIQSGEVEIEDSAMRRLESITEACRTLVQEVAVVDYGAAA